VSGTLHRYAAFTDTPTGGNPAGVWIGEVLPEPVAMQRIATEVGFSETAFLAPGTGRSRTIRYYSPAAEVPFCGHATIAAGVVLGEQAGAGMFELHTSVGTVPVAVSSDGGRRIAALTSVTPRHEEAGAPLVDAVLTAIDWQYNELDPGIVPVRAYAGAWHLVLAAATFDRLDRLHYRFDPLREVMLADGLTTVQLVWRESATLFHARNPFPVGGVVEDPATGAAAAALGGYLRDAGLMAAPGRFTIRQGEAMGRPSLLTVDVPAAGGILVSGGAVALGPTEFANGVSHR
jgi:PhzF family phenazine biosynthesis protein